MAPTTIMTLPPELRDRIYEYIVLPDITRYIETFCSSNSNGWEYRTVRSAMTATYRLIRDEYEDVARKLTTALDFRAMDMDFSPIMEYFNRRVDAKYLEYLRLNKATIHVTFVYPNKRFELPMSRFYEWSLFLIGLELEVAYHSDPYTWMWIFETCLRMSAGHFEDQFIVDENTPQAVRENLRRSARQPRSSMLNIGRIILKFFQELQIVRHAANGEQRQRVAP